MKKKSVGVKDRLGGELKASPSKRSRHWIKTATIIAAIIGGVAAIIAAAVLLLSSSKESEPSQRGAITSISGTVSMDGSKDNPSKLHDNVKSQQPEKADPKNDIQVDPNTIEPKEIKASRGGYILTAIPGGKFPLGVNSEFEPHPVTIKSFYIGKYEVTNEEYALFLKENPDIKKPDYWTDEKYNRPKQPVVGVSFDNAKKYCDWAGLRLPSEAEWEWAARAGARSFFSSGNYEEDLDKVAWFGGNADNLHAVGEKDANLFGLYDMHGNAWEWVEDDYHPNYNGAPTDGSAWVDAPRAEKRVIRGGSFIYSSDNCRSAYRGLLGFGFRDYGLGFRPAKSIP